MIAPCMASRSTSIFNTSDRRTLGIREGNCMHLSAHFCLSVFSALVPLLMSGTAVRAQPAPEIVEPRITALSQPRAAMITVPGEAPRDLRAHEALSGQLIDVA